jgi:hypothetical protein
VVILHVRVFCFIGLQAPNTDYLTESDFPDLINDAGVLLAVIERIRFMRDGGPCSTNFRKKYRDRWIGRGEDTAWPHAHLI